MDQDAVEMWLVQAHLDGVLITTQQYNDTILAVLANEQTLVKECKKLRRYPAISSCMEKYRAVYCVTTTNPKPIFSSFPLGEGEEWYLGPEKTAYLCVQSHVLNDEQISWLSNSRDIIAWQYFFELTSVSTGH